MKNSIIEPAKPHTIKKFELMEAYVDGWARKLLGYKEADGIIFIDCMCNCGVYYDENNEKIDGTAIRIAKRLNSINEKYGKNVRIYFNDFSKEKVEILKSELKQYSLDNVVIETSVADANVFLKNLDIVKFENHNTLLFYDPYQATIDWDAVTPYLQRWGEVIINHMVSDSIRGIRQVKEGDKIKKYESTYKKRIEELIELGTDRQAFERIIKDIILEQTKMTNREAYIASFPFFNRTNQLLFNLIYHSTNKKGFNLFKKKVWETFGGKSSARRDSQLSGQISMNIGNFDTKAVGTMQTDEAYTIYDMAKYVYEKYKLDGNVPLKTIYDDLENHPIFPCDGYKDKLKKILEDEYGATRKLTSIIFNR